MGRMSAETVQQGWVPTATDFGTRLLLVRKHLGLTVRDAAGRSGVHYATWSTWERGTIPADKGAEVAKISQALGVDPTWLMWGGELPRKDSNLQPAGQKFLQFSKRIECGITTEVATLEAYRDRRRVTDRRRLARPARPVRTRSGTGSAALSQLKAS